MTFQPPLCVISTHLDDGVLSCGHAMLATPGAVLVTVYTAGHGGPVSDWDRRTGATTSDEAARCRREEDAEAALALGARPVWLDLLESQYTDQPRAARVEEARIALRVALDELRPATVLAPLGIEHADHQVVAEACRGLVGAASVRWFLYEDVPYSPTRTLLRRVRRRLLRIPDGRTEALREARRQVSCGRTVTIRMDDDRKWSALQIYRSQLEALHEVYPRLEERVRAAERYREVVLR